MEKEKKLNENYSRYEKSRNQLIESWTENQADLYKRCRELWVNMDHERTKINNLKIGDNNYDIQKIQVY